MKFSERSRNTVRRAAVAVLAVTWAAAAHAHDRTHSYSTWQFAGSTVQVRARLAELDTTHFEWGLYPSAQRDRAAAMYLVNHLHLSVDGQPCVASSPARNLQPGPGRLAFSWTLQCPPGREVQLRSDVLFDVVPTHLHFVRVVGTGEGEREKVLTATQREWRFPLGGHEHPRPPADFLGYVALGVEHIATGYDHLAFVFALLLLGGSLSALAKVVTAFTIAHSVTLALSVLGWVRPQAPAVEALIGFSIAMVAVENLWLRSHRRWEGPWILVLGAVIVAAVATTGRGQVPAAVAAGVALFAASFFALVRHGNLDGSWRWVVAFLFGLVHGFGFASVLVEVELPPAALALALAGFNLGVELGQLAVVVLTWPGLRWLGRHSPATSGWVIDAGSAVVFALGTYWFLFRTYG